MYFLALCLFNCSLVSDVPGCGLQVSCREQRRIFVAPDWKSVKEKALQVPATAAEHTLQSLVPVIHAPFPPAGRQLWSL